MIIKLFYSFLFLFFVKCQNQSLKVNHPSPFSSSLPQQRSIPFFSPFTPFLTQQSLPGPQFGRPSQPLPIPQHQQKHYRHHHSLPQISEEEKINETFPKPEEFLKKGILIGNNNKTNEKENEEREQQSKEEKLFKKWQWKNEEKKEENAENNQKQLNRIPPPSSSSFHQLKSSEENKNERKEFGNKQIFNLKSNEIIQGRRMENERESQELSKNQQKLNFQNKQQHKIQQYSTESNENIKYPNSESHERWTPKHTNNRQKLVAPTSSSSNSREENRQNKYSSNEQQNNRRGPPPPPPPPPQPPKSPPLIFSNNQQKNFHPTDFFPEHIRNGFPPFPEPFENNYRQNNE
ncbi:unnamed protein product [Meloidogyne enterolobii]|uniref:Uncharacterized protein n=1 Tax=Meloidogyne enterolobii TaxID=390850 RepID=A0ACB0Y1I7_MELEN